MATSEALGGGTLHTLTCDEVRQLMEHNKIVLIDVRTPAEFAIDRIEGAILAPMSTIDPHSLPLQPGGKPIVFHCGSGIRSKKVAEKYISAGYGEVSHMEGGMAQWKKLKYPLISIDYATGAEVKINQPAS